MNTPMTGEAGPEPRKIPVAVVAVVAEELAGAFTHTKIESIFRIAEAPGDPPGGSKIQKCTDWLLAANRDMKCNPLNVLGGVIEEYMDQDPTWVDPSTREKGRERITASLAKYGLAYHRGGKIVGGGLSAVPTKSLEQVLRDHDLPSVNKEFQRAMESVDRDPEAAVTSACAIIEALCRIHIEDRELTMPAKLDVGSLWAVVKRDLRLEAAETTDDDIRKILGGLASVVDGIGALRTHAGSAHGKGRAPFPLRPRHARLAVHAAHTLVTYLIERASAE
jgi:hypothetical protein